MQQERERVARGRDQGPPHPVLAQRRPERRRRRWPRATRRGPRPRPKARATYAKLKADPEPVRRDRARGERRGRRRSPAAASCRTSRPRTPIDQAFADAIFAPGLQPGQLLEPVKSAFGWHVIQVMHGPTDLEWADTLKTEHRRRDADVRRRRPRQLRQRRGRRRAATSAGSARASSTEENEAGDLRGADRQGQRPARGRRRRHLPVPRVATSRPASRTPSRRRRSRAPRSRSGTRSRRPTSTITRDPAIAESPRRPDAGTAGRTMLDALLAEARLRWGLDPAAGLARRRRGAARRDADRAVRPAADRARLARARERPTAPTSRRCPAATARRRRDPVAVLRRLYPADHPVGRFGRPDGDDGRRADRRRPRGRRCTSRPVAPVADIASPWGMPWISARLREPDGCPWDREQTHESLRNHLLEEAYEVYDALEAGATPELAGRARRPAAPGRPPRAARRRGGRVRHDRRVGRDRVEDRPPPPARVRRGRGADRVAT